MMIYCECLFSVIHLLQVEWELFIAQEAYQAAAFIIDRAENQDIHEISRWPIRLLEARRLVKYIFYCDKARTSIGSSPVTVLIL